jgi:predicted phosphodiesterase
MTRLAILADIHGNLPALETVLADLAQFTVEQVVVAKRWPVIRGNNEFYLIEHETPRAPAAWANRAQWRMLDWLRAQLPGHYHQAVAEWPDTLSLRYRDAPALRVVHGSLRRNNEPLYPTATEADITEALAGGEETTVVAAHTHLAMDRQVGRWHLLNPGTVGVPLSGQHCASYMLLEGDADGWRATRRTLPLDPAPVLAEFERQDFVAQVGVVGQLVLREFANARLEAPPFLQWKQQHYPEAPLDEALLPAYAAADPRDYLPEPYWPGWERTGKD